MNGFNGISLISSKATPVQRPNGMFGLVVNIVGDKIGVQIKDMRGRGIPNVTVSCTNASSADPRSGETDVDGLIYIKADTTTTITVSKNKTSKTYSYNSVTDGTLVTIILDPLPLR